jgi:hypothetical protein
MCAQAGNDFGEPTCEATELGRWHRREERARERLVISLKLGDEPFRS